MNQALARRTGSASLVVSLALVLAACDGGVITQGPASIRMVAGELEVAICAPMDISSIKIEERDNGQFRQWTTVQSGQGRAAINAGEVFSLAGPPDGIQMESVASLELLEGNEIAVVLEGEHFSYTSFSVTRNWLQSGEWLRNDAAIGREPCPERPQPSG